MLVEERCTTEYFTIYKRIIDFIIHLEVFVRSKMEYKMYQK